MLSGHVDSWYYGAMDNGSANATMLEVVRLLARRRSALRRGLRVAFWSGHSHGRYAGSARYADHAWQDLHDHCVAHVNVDSTGGKGATVLTEGNSMAEMRSFASDVIEAVAGQRLSPRRFGRSGDQSFWGHGIPALLMTLSEQPPERPIRCWPPCFARSAAGTEERRPRILVAHPRGHRGQDRSRVSYGGTPYHLYLAWPIGCAPRPSSRSTTWRWRRSLQGLVRDLQGKAVGHFDLSQVAERLGDLESALEGCSRPSSGSKRGASEVQPPGR